MALLESGIRKILDLKKAFFGGLVGWLIMFAAYTLVLINFLYSGKLTWFADLLKIGPAIFIVTSATSFICLFVFYKTFIQADLFDQRGPVRANQNQLH
jgi:hypothetical protein